MARLPPPVRPGDRVGVAALSGAIDEQRLARGLENLTRLGLEPVLAENLNRKEFLFAGTDGERLESFHRLAADPTLKAIFFARGGHGLLRVLPFVDWQLLARHPRAYVGYSDLTPFLLEVVHRLGLVAFHGPMIAADFARDLLPEEEESLWSCLGGHFPQLLTVDSWVRQKPAQGPLLGGCLSLLTACLGTPFAPRLEGGLLFWEEVNEPLYRLDRMLTHLRLSGSLNGLSGMVVGHIVWDSDETSPDLALSELFQQTLGDFSWPLAHGMRSGHQSPNLTLPLGMGAVMDPTAGGLVVGER
ncbi:MAG: LD-carboxypeptidase [Deltaproteobacteria bacterium]|nr:LD-carboxypeptidase [Deltaproteobacteria bacterium]